MEPSGYAVSMMSVEQTMALARRLGLLRDVNQIIWEKLVQKGMYEGSPNPEIPYENKYPREKILGMDTWTNWFVEKLELLPEVKQLVTAVTETMRLSPATVASSGFPFTDLPAELQVDILGRVSPTAREGVLVSQTMKELADQALLNNLRYNNSVDPTIGAPERSEFFKINAKGQGEYFSPEPGLWRQIKASRTNPPSEREMMHRRERFKRLVPKFHVFDTQDFLVYGTSATFGKFAAIASYDGLAVNPRIILTLDATGPNPEDFVTVDVYIRIDLDELLDKPVEETSSFSAHISDQLAGSGHWAGTAVSLFITSSGNENARVYMIPLNEDNMRKAEIILPSLREDVRIISNRKESLM